MPRNTIFKSVDFSQSIQFNAINQIYFHKNNSTSSAFSLLYRVVGLPAPKWKYFDFCAAEMSSWQIPGPMAVGFESSVKWIVCAVHVFSSLSLDTRVCGCECLRARAVNGNAASTIGTLFLLKTEHRCSWEWERVIASYLFVPFRYEAWTSSVSCVQVLVFLSQSYLVLSCTVHTVSFCYFLLLLCLSNVARIDEHWRSGNQAKHTRFVYISYIHVDEIDDKTAKIVFVFSFSAVRFAKSLAKRTEFGFLTFLNSTDRLRDFQKHFCAQTISHMYTSIEQRRQHIYIYMYIYNLCANRTKIFHSIWLCERANVRLCVYVECNQCAGAQMCADLICCVSKSVRR